MIRSVSSARSLEQQAIALCFEQFQPYLSKMQLKQVASALKVESTHLGQQLFESQTSQAGFYWVLQGRARLLDVQGNLVATLEAGENFGAQSLFPQLTFQVYSLRASADLIVASIPAETLSLKLLQQSEGLHGYLMQEAWILDVLLLEQLRSRPHSFTALRSRLRGAAVYRLPVGPTQLSRAQAAPLMESELWIVRQGILIHPSGQRLTAGSVIASESVNGSASLNPECAFTSPMIGLEQLKQTFDQWSVEQPLELWGVPRRAPVASISPSPCQASPRHQAQKRPRPLRALSENIKEGSEEGLNHRPPARLPTEQKRVGQAYFPQPQLQARQFFQQVFRRYPFVAQQSAVDCGIVCLTMIGQFWGKRLDVNQLRVTAGVDRSGTSLKGLIQAAESVGFAPRPVQATLEQLSRQQLPAIAHWEGKHFVVVYRITAQQVHISDPAIGRLRLSKKAFQSQWSGYTLLLQPTPFLDRAPEAKRDLWRFVALIRPHFPILFEVLAASLMTQLFGLFMPLLTQMLLDRVITQRSESTFFAVSIGLIIFSLFSLLMRSLRRYLLFHTANKIDLSLITGFINHTLRLPLSYFETRYVGDITARIQENRKIRNFLTSEAITTLLDVTTLFLYIGLMLWYSWQMTLVALIPIPIFLVMTLITTPILQRISREVFATRTIESSYLIEVLSGIGTVKSMGLERSVRWRWEERFHQFIRTKFSGRIVRERINLLSSLIETAAGTGLMILGVWLVLQQRLTIGQLFAFNMLVGRVVSPFQRLISLWNDFQEILIAVERLNDVIDAAPEESHHTARVTLPPLQGHIHLEQVVFRYDVNATKNILDSINVEIQPGQTVALVGRSGSGKTTLSKLLLGLYPPTHGRVLIDGYDLSTVSLESLRQQVGVVDQNTFLFGGSIRENIAIAKPDVTLDDIRVAARQAGAAEFIEAMPMQYDTQIGEGGGMLSGGQRQRLAIARALLARPPVLILDEATSSLDAESERIIQSNLTEILHQQTTIVIAHRLSTVRNADLILVLDDGVIVERGTHVELMAKRGHYYYLNQQQFMAA